MAKLNTKYKAFTILESMVAMVIVMIVFGLFSVLVLTIGSSGFNKTKQDAHTYVQHIRNEALQQHRLLDETVMISNIRIEKVIEDYSIDAGLKVLQITAYQDQEKLAESKEIVVLNHLAK